MFFHRRRSTPVWLLILAVLGVRSLWRTEPLTEVERTTLANKRKVFREKIREAFDVWRSDSPVDSDTNE